MCCHFTAFSVQTYSRIALKLPLLESCEDTMEPEILKKEYFPTFSGERPRNGTLRLKDQKEMELKFSFA